MNNSDLYAVGKKWEEKERLDKAYSYYLEAVHSEDDGEAYYALARMYYYGEYVSKNYDKAGLYVAMAFDRGVIHKIWPLIHAGDVFEHKYRMNEGEENLSKALKYYEFAAENGIGYGYDCLGNLYLETGEYDKALDALNNSDGMNTLGFYAMGRIYDEGLGVQKDRNKAMELYQRTLEIGDGVPEEYGKDRYAREAETRLREFGVMSTKTVQ